MSMKMYTVNAITSLHEGRVVLSEKQAHRRRHNIKKIEGDLYEVLRPVQFKVGEQIGLDETTLKKVHLMNLVVVGGETEEKKDAKEIKTAEGPKDPSGKTDPDPVDLDALHWTEVKKLVEAKGGTWVNKIEGIEFLKSQNNGG